MRTLTAIVIMMVSGQALARQVEYIEADVVSVVPVIQDVQVVTPERNCWQERQYGSRRDGHGDHGVGLVVGGVVGGAIGHGLGHKKRNKQVGAVVGSILGATLGNAISHKRRHHRQSEWVEHCEVVETRREESRIVGYDVEYEYAGTVHETRMSRDPGSTLRLRVEVQPIS